MYRREAGDFTLQAFKSGRDFNGGECFHHLAQVTAHDFGQWPGGLGPVVDDDALFPAVGSDFLRPLTPADQTPACLSSSRFSFRLSGVPDPVALQ